MEPIGELSVFGSSQGRNWGGLRLRVVAETRRSDVRLGRTGEVQIEQIGTLRNPMRDEAAA
jgi:hypothetical protein